MKIAIASKNYKLIERLNRAIDLFEKSRNSSIEVVNYNSYLELINELSGNETIIFTDESLVNSEKELHFLKILKNKNAAVNLIHIFDKYAPFTMDEIVINSTSKFLKSDYNIDQRVLKSLSILTQNDLSTASYGY